MTDYKPTAAEVKALRGATGAGMLEVRNALVEFGGDADAAKKALRERGGAKAAKLAGRGTSQGAIGSYIHKGAQKGVLVEVQCETDFVGSNETFLAFVKDICIQIVSMDGTRWVSVDDVPEEAREAELDIFRNQAREEGRPDAMLDRIADGRLKKWYEDCVVLNQPFWRDEKTSVEDARAALSRETGENIKIKRFARFDVGS